MIDYDMIYLLTAVGLTPGGSSAVHIYTQTVHRTTQNKQYIEEHNNLGECGPCPVLARFTLAFALQLRNHKKFLRQQKHAKQISPKTLRIHNEGSQMSHNGKSLGLGIVRKKPGMLQTQ